MNNEFKTIKTDKETIFVLETTSGGTTSAASVGSGSVVKALGQPHKRITDEEAGKVPQKPRQGPLRPQTGGGTHRDKKREQKQGQQKHRKPFMEYDLEEIHEPGHEPDHEISMANSQLLSIIEDAMRLIKIIKHYSEMEGLEAWQQSKLTKAADYLNAVLNNLQGKEVFQKEDHNDYGKGWGQESYNTYAGTRHGRGVAEGSNHSIEIDGKEVDSTSIEVDGVDPRDYPDFSDAYLSYAEFVDGTPLNDEQLDQLNNDYSDLIYDLAYDSLHEGVAEEIENTIDGMSIEELEKFVDETLPILQQLYKEKSKTARDQFNELKKQYDAALEKIYDVDSMNESTLQEKFKSKQGVAEGQETDSKLIPGKFYIVTQANYPRAPIKPVAADDWSDDSYEAQIKKAEYDEGGKHDAAVAQWTGKDWNFDYTDSEQGVAEGYFDDDVFIDKIVTKIEKEIYDKKLKGEDALYYLRVQLLDQALKWVGRHLRKNYEPYLEYVENWEDAKEFLTVAYRHAQNKGMAEGYILKKTNVDKYMEPGDPDEYTQDINIKDTDYEIINNKTGQVVGTASWTTNDFFGPGALKITMKNGATRYLDIWASEKGNPQTAFNRFVKDPKTAKKYKEQGVAEGSGNTVDFPIANVRRPNGAIGTQGVTTDQVAGVLKNVTGLDVSPDMSMKELVDTLRGNAQAQQQLRQFTKQNPVKIQELPDGTYHIQDGHHRTFLLNLLGDKTVPALVNGGQQGVAEEKIKGADGKACWKGKRYAGTKNGKDICIPVGEEETNESGLLAWAGRRKHGADYMKKASAAARKGASQEELGRLKDRYSKAEKVKEAEKKGLYYYVNKRKKAGTSRPASHPDAPSPQDWKNAAKTAKTEDVYINQLYATLNEKMQSRQQSKLMHAAANDPAVAKKTGVSQTVAKEFVKASHGQKVSKLPKRVKKDK